VSRYWRPCCASWGDHAATCPSVTAPDARQSDEPWRVGTSWGIHVYQGEKGSPGERPVATFHDPADAQRAVDAVNGGADVHQSDELREALVDALAASVGGQVPRGWVWRPDPVVDAILPVVAAWAEAQARARAAEELRAAASWFEAERVRIAGLGSRVEAAVLGDAARDLRIRAVELTTGDPA
jgi:hypothetical protein